jgi:putative PIN family toxin of toxin-antitoxin system
VRVLLDTNVLVAAFATRGLCADVVRVVLAEHELITSDVVLEELRDVLDRRLKLPASTVAEVFALLRAQDVVPKPAKPSDVPIRDPADRWILASAVAGRADVLVTGDDDLLAVGNDAPLPIVSPRGFWDQLRSRK